MHTILTKLSEVEGFAVPLETVFEALNFIPSAEMRNRNLKKI